MASPPTPLRPTDIKVANDGSMLDFGFKDRSGKNVRIEVSLEMFDDLMIAWQTAAKLAHQRFHKAAVEAARSGGPRELQS